MSSPVLYEEYDRQTALDLFRNKSAARSLCDGQWMIWSDSAVCFAEVSGPPSKSHFTCGSSFAWVAEKPYRVSNDEFTHFVPAEVTGQEGLKRDIQLFVRSANSRKYRFVGKLQSSHHQRAGGKDNYGEAHFDLRPALPSEIWSQIGDFDPGDLNYEKVDDALKRLGESIGTSERLDILKVLVQYWHGEIGDVDGFSEEELSGFEIPPVLRWWYRFAGRRKEILSGQNNLLDPSQLKMTADGKLVFYGENQWCYQWAILPTGDDPPVFGREDDSQPWQNEEMTLSEHLILACLFEGTMCHCRYGASAAWLDSESVARIIEHVPPISINAWHWCKETRFFAKDGAFVFTMSNGDFDGQKGCSVWIGAKTEKPLQFLKPMLDDSWEYVAV